MSYFHDRTSLEKSQCDEQGRWTLKMVRVCFRLELKVCDRLAPLCDGAAWRIIRADRYSIWWPEIQQVVRAVFVRRYKKRDVDYVELVVRPKRQNPFGIASAS